VSGPEKGRVESILDQAVGRWRPFEFSKPPPYAVVCGTILGERLVRDEKRFPDDKIDIYLTHPFVRVLRKDKVGGDVGANLLQSIGCDELKKMGDREVCFCLDGKLFRAKKGVDFDFSV